MITETDQKGGFKSAGVLIARYRNHY